ncbi:isopeptide-forming domain-containing fimbrial protein [Corynebacterium sp. ES2715-CONJ3]|uniref:isopeptide-forming domain-containing fimbrial protein n=1 Tax=Corynebacterium sp. ES2715-CONJ3 TaxID=2974028 RepID=UPI0021695436|nr:isopeptide-forming domain-containing fimbrial protein [Corynebacterium sp. ES2715-CONJ3]MCS4492310.1 isopeptide-forming domain-containing fimbrial protein [Corynebacterium sp. ES2715-CONJ3]
MLLHSHPRVLGLGRSLIAALLAVSTIALVIVPAHAQAPRHLQIVKTFANPTQRTDGVVGPEQLIGATFTIRQLFGLGELDPSQLNDLILQRPELLTSDPQVNTGPVMHARTDDNGVALFSGLEPGIYQVREDARRMGDTPELVSTPFLVIVDQPSTAVRTKIQPPSVTKRADRETADWGETIAYSITAQVPPVDSNGQLHRVEFFDSLDTNLDFEGIDTIVVENLDGSVRLEANDYRTSVEANEVSISLSDAGLTTISRLRAGHPETTVNISFRARVKAPLFPGTKISNTIYASADGYCPADTQMAGCLGAYPALKSDTAITHAPQISSGSSIVTGVVVPLLALFLTLGFGWLPLSQLLLHPPSRPDITQDKNSWMMQSPIGALASTGASVLGLVGLALLLVTVGLWLVVRRRPSGDEDGVYPKSES